MLWHGPDLQPRGDFQSVAGQEKGCSWLRAPSDSFCVWGLSPCLITPLSPGGGGRGGGKPCRGTGDSGSDTGDLGPPGVRSDAQAKPQKEEKEEQEGGER